MIRFRSLSSKHDCADASLDPLEQLERQEDAARLMRIITAWEPERRESLLAKHRCHPDNLNQTQVARRFAKSSSHVTRLGQKGTQDLREILNKA